MPHRCRSSITGGSHSVSSGVPVLPPKGVVPEKVQVKRIFIKGGYQFSNYAALATEYPNAPGLDRR